ncbi:Protein of unknown function [Seinonella peptonophila]|uniref:DUF1811 family protein n=1 Tax=Seinonella peptonophila TaxID=112248 RepID=A0A1M4Z4S2_9BACL|nr:DUF1811 family protein [Seinonella peptonophila]SHF13054.1 Protein of unknown function [Seinonella peptonophila]
MLYSQMNKKELENEVERLKKQLQSSHSHEQETLKQQYDFARSYLIKPETIEPLVWYQVENESQQFFVQYLNGIMAWGNWMGETQLIALPIAKLERNNE